MLSRKAHILCIGASLTEGFIALGAPPHPYAITLGKLLGVTFSIQRFGCSGQTSKQIREIVPMTFPSAFPYFGAIVMCGSNDLFGQPPTETIANIESILKSYLGHCGERNRVVAITLPQMAAEMQYPHITRSRAAVNDWIRSFSKSNGLILFDFDKEIPGCCSGKASDLWSRDGIHMTTKGYDVLGEHIYQAVRPFWI